MPSVVHMGLESEIARAHRALYRAAENANILNYQSLTFELEAMLAELAKMLEDLLKNPKRN